MSWFSSSSSGPNIHPVQSSFDQQALYGPLTKEDNEWLCPGGIATETQVWYTTLPNGAVVMAQVIHSSVGLLWPNIQWTFRFCDGKGKNVWKSVSVSNFKTAPSPKLDKRSAKSDQFTITVDPSTPTKMTVEGKYDDDVQISLVFDQLCPGFKVGAGPRGGMTYFGQLSTKAPAGPAPDVSAGGDGYAVHRFWPRCAVSGIVRTGSDVVDLSGSRGVFIHAIQGLRPNLLAARWNFANFQSVPQAGEKDDGVALVMMEFTTPAGYGSKTVNVGCVVVGDKLVAVTAGGSGVSGGSSATHVEPVKDAETGYNAPSAVKFVWEGAALEGEGGALKPVEGANAKVHATLLEELLVNKEGYQTQGLVEKVDVLGQIPYLIRKFVNYAAGTKPYIYTWLNPVQASITVGNGTETTTTDAKGYIFSESTFISE
ncbi:hypothetical protein JCM10207_003604 [Rhodosporidiobolus poonsookiae]